MFLAPGNRDARIKIVQFGHPESYFFVLRLRVYLCACVRVCVCV